MATGHSILFMDSTAWRLGVAGPTGAELIDIETTDQTSPQAIATAVAEALKQTDYAGEGLILAIPSDHCLCGSIKTDGLPSRHRHEAMVYRLEESLPLPAEEVIADFLPQRSADVQTLGICTEKKVLAPLIEALENAGVLIVSICPAALLGLQQMLHNLPAVAVAEVIVLPGASRDVLELFLFRNGRLCDWQLITHQPQDLLLHLRVHLLLANPEKTIRASAGEVSPEIRAALTAFPNLRLIDAALPAWELAAITLAGAILAGKAVPWIDLRRDGLAMAEPFRQVRAPLISAILATAACLLCVCGGLIYRANRYDRLAHQYLDQQQVVFHEAFPNELAPADVPSRLAAEERRLRGLSGDASTPAQKQTGLVTLRELITHLPSADALRYRVLELRLDQDRFTLEGQAVGHGDADLIVQELRQGGMFLVDPPRTEQLGDAADQNDTAAKGVAFTVTGTVVSNASESPRVSR